MHEDRFNQSFEKSNELKRKIKKFWPTVAHHLTETRKALKQVTPRLKVVEEEKEQSIKMLFG